MNLDEYGYWQVLWHEHDAGLDVIKDFHDKIIAEGLKDCPEDFAVYDVGIKNMFWMDFPKNEQQYARMRMEDTSLRAVPSSMEAWGYGVLADAYRADNHRRKQNNIFRRWGWLKPLPPLPPTIIYGERATRISVRYRHQSRIQEPYDFWKVQRDL